MLRNPTTQLGIAQISPNPTDGIPCSGLEYATNDEIAVPLRVELVKLAVPEQRLQHLPRRLKVSERRLSGR
jgi:hypothetical protein